MSDQSPMIQDEEKDLPFYMTYIPEFFQKKCELELNETPERKEQCIQELRVALKDDKLRKDLCFHEDLLIQYLRHSKYNTKKALKQLHNLIVFRKKESKYFETIPDEYFTKKKPNDEVYSVLFPKKARGSQWVLFQAGKWDPNELKFEDFKKIIFITCMQILRDPMTQINGFKFIHDFAGTRFEHLKYCTPESVYLLYYISFVFFHSDMRELLNYFPKSVLPEQYGGEILDIYETNFSQRANKEQKKNTIEGQPNFF
ncbi:Clavesin-1 like protein [Argiope bruennichi]|uniref:Clavesin-1 like protein n=1 Tax=Argiope bruennichi TaxID=94029 RepID=A0A8T0EUA3_ARGBR|nr:Clavesin-1 like protein [Argiope bruennichi]